MNPHERAANKIIPQLIDKINASKGRYIITLAGESGCGKTETGKALVEALKAFDLGAVVLGQDNYFFLPPAANDARRKADATWLGPRKEVNLNQMEETIVKARNGADAIEIAHIEYDTNVESVESVDITQVKVIIAEGTYTTLLKNVDTKIFIDADYNDTLKYRKLRNRGNEVNDPFVEKILETEHKIIAGHIFLADYIISKDYDVIEA